VLPAERTVTLCAIDTTKWAEQAEVAANEKVNCTLCAEQLKVEAK
jgi:hypothetical protein